MKKYILTALFTSLLCSTANAYDTYYVPESESSTFTFNVYSPGESIVIYEEYISSDFKIPQKYILPIIESANNYNDMLGLQTSPVVPAIYSYVSQNEYNAAAASPYVTVAELPYKVTRTNAILHNWTITTPQSELDNFESDGVIMVGLGVSETFPGWETFSTKQSLYHGKNPDLYSVMNHEMMHSLGVTSAAAQYYADDDDIYSDKSYYFSEDPAEPLSIFDSTMRIYTGDSDPIYDPTNEIAPIAGQKIGEEAGDYDIANNSPYLVGENTIKVLGNSDDYNTARLNIINNGGLVNYSDAYYDDITPDETEYPTVYGLPIHPYDIEGDYDLSHIELRNSYMSHQDFRNWLIPMEAELALLNDIGYNVDLRKYFGKSYYLDGVTDTYTNGFSQWDGTTYTGIPSTIDQAVGIHIYGNNNDITQAGNNIETMGEGAIGVRVDGEGNTYTLSSGAIHSNGTENIGVAVTWGNGHEINLDNGTEITATGDDGIAASFDFGGNLMGTSDSNIKGSYINYVDDENLNPDNANQGPLVSNFNVNGTLDGSKAAIYISDNAYVQNININDGAKINGDIVSEWNSVSSLDKAYIQLYDSSTDEWETADIDNPAELYHTNLNFNTPNGVDVNGDITGDNKVYNTLKMDNKSGSEVNFYGSKIDVNSLNNNGDININNDATISTFDAIITGNGDINVLSASLDLSGITSIENNLNMDNASFNLVNNSVDSVEFGGMELTGTNSITIDVDLNSNTSDTLVFNNSDDLIVNSGASLKISNVNLMKTNKVLTDKNNFITFISSDYNNQNLLGNVIFSAQKSNILTPIFKYNLGYSENGGQGGIILSRGKTKEYTSYNPAIVTSSVAAQIGGYLSQINSYEQAFNNLDMKMLMTRKEREALKFANKYASETTPTIFSPIYLQEKDSAGWFSPYASFEKADLKNGPKVESIAYGSYFGADSPMFETKNGWDYQFSAYAGYNGSHQNYTGNSIYQNGGTLGATAILYKDDFFTSITANVGAAVAEASTMYGSENFTMLMSGIASKTGYNWELAEGRFIIQPSYLMSYTFVNTFDYTNAAGVRIKSDPLNAINIAPGLKFIGNLQNGWQPYIGMQMVWNIMDKTDFKANDVALSDMSVKPYFQYGIGIQKRWGDRFTGFLQTMLRNGGRNGAALSAGFRWTLGKKLKRIII